MSELITMDKRDLIKAFRDYQKEWLYSHHDFELSPMLEEVFAKFLDDTAERFMVEKSQLLEEGTTKDATSDLISRHDAIDAVEFGITYAKAINKSTGEVKELFKEGNKALNEAVERLKELPSAEPEIIRCKDCKYAEVADPEDSQDGYICQFHRGSIWFSGCYCSWAERRTDG